MDNVSVAMLGQAIEAVADSLAEEKVECFRCEEVVARIETENSVCNWCLEAEHQVQERHR